MPIFEFKCPGGCKTARYLTLQMRYNEAQICERHGYIMEQIISAPLLVKVAQDVCYDSPITGKPITSWQARQEDLKQHGCIPYDPEMKTDAARRRQEGDDKLEAAIEATVEEKITKMTTRQRGKLHSELIDQGLTCEPVRSTPTT